MNNILQYIYRTLVLFARDRFKLYRINMYTCYARLRHSASRRFPARHRRVPPALRRLIQPRSYSSNPVRVTTTGQSGEVSAIYRHFQVRFGIFNYAARFLQLVYSKDDNMNLPR